MGETNARAENIAQTVRNDPRVNIFSENSLSGLPLYQIVSNAPITPNEMRQVIEAEKARVLWVHLIGDRDSLSYMLRFQLGRGKTGYMLVAPDMTLLH